MSACKRPCVCIQKNFVSKRKLLLWKAKWQTLLFFLNFNITFSLCLSFSLVYCRKRQLTTADITNLNNAATQIPPYDMDYDYDSEFNKVRIGIYVVSAVFFLLGVILCKLKKITHIWLKHNLINSFSKQNLSDIWCLTFKTIRWIL